MTLLLGEKRKLEGPGGLAATVAAAAPQKRRRLRRGVLRAENYAERCSGFLSGRSIKGL